MRAFRVGRVGLSFAVLVSSVATALLGFPGAVVASVPSGGCANASGTTTCTFDYTGAVEHWTVPAGVSEITIDAYGAAAGVGASNAASGKGAHVHAVVPVTSSEVLDVTVGGKGADYPDGPTNAFGGGGASTLGGGGGGGSFVFDGGTALAIAGGGGGDGSDGTRFGGTGGDSGSAGGAGQDFGTATGGGGGGAGTSSAGGAGGDGYTCGTLWATNDGGDGSLGQGGNGNLYGGGGGGGGYYGGGGGGGVDACDADESGAGGGGGGSSHTDASASDVSVTDGARSGNGLVTIAYQLYVPATTIDLSGTMGSNGWYTSAVTVSVSATDSNGIAEIRCELDPAQSPASFFQMPSGCDYAPGADVSDPGSHTLWAAAIDTADNVDSPVSRSFKIDTTAPDVTANITGTQGDNGWYVSNVHISFSEADPESGLASVTGCGTHNLRRNTAGRDYSCAATNGAGVGKEVVAIIKRDVSAPATAISAPTARRYGPNAWNNRTCATPGFCGTAVDYGPSGVGTVWVLLKQKATGLFWNGSTFTSTKVWLPATGTTSWSMPFAYANFSHRGKYVLRAVATDNAGNTGYRDSVTFRIRKLLD